MGETSGAQISVCTASWLALTVTGALVGQGRGQWLWGGWGDDTGVGVRVAAGVGSVV